MVQNRSFFGQNGGELVGLKIDHFLAGDSFLRGLVPGKWDFFKNEVIFALFKKGPKMVIFDRSLNFEESNSGEIAVLVKNGHFKNDHF